MREQRPDQIKAAVSARHVQRRGAAELRTVQCGAITGIMRAVFLFSTSYCRSRMFECVVLSLFHRRRGRLKVQRIDKGVHRTVIFFRNGPLQVRRPLEK